MALIFMDGMDTYGATADISTKWSGRAGFIYDATGGRYGGKCHKFTADSNVYFHTCKSNIINSNEVYFAFWFKGNVGGTSPQNSCWVAFSDSTNDFDTTVQASDRTAHMSLHGNTFGWRPWRSSATSVTIAGTANVVDNQWHWIEVYVKFDTASGVIQQYVDGVLDINFAGVTATTANPVLDKFHFRTPATGSGVYYLDDLVIWDNSGTGLVAANFPMGPQKIITLLPSADTADKDFNRSAGSDNYALVDEAAVDSDTTYVESAVNDHLDLYDFGALGVTPNSIETIAVNACVKNPEAGSVNAKLAVKSNGDSALSSAQAVTVSYKTVQAEFAVDPDTSAAWTGSAVDAAQFGLQVST